MRMPDSQSFLRLFFKKGNCPSTHAESKASGSKAFFLEKKKQKTFGRFGFGAAGDARPRGSKVFWFFFSKKNRLLPLIFASVDSLGPTRAVTKKRCFLP
jgi:hypothetical protein